MLARDGRLLKCMHSGNHDRPPLLRIAEILPGAML